MYYLLYALICFKYNINMLNRKSKFQDVTPPNSTFVIGTSRF